MVEYFKHNLGIILLTFACIVSLYIFKDYGISWDEDTQRETGKLTYEYVFNINEELLKWPDKDYGVAFELPLYMIEKALDLEDTRSIYLSRHLTTHLFYLIGAFFCFLLIDLLYKNKLLATIGFLLIILHPRIYAHSFFNTKDIPFMAMFIICLYLNAKAFQTKQIKHFILLGISYGLLINLRLMGVILPFITTVLLFLDYYKKKDKTNLKLWLLLAITSCITLYISWPYLWNNPIGNFYDALRNMSRFRWEGQVLFNGDYTKSRFIGWIYIPTWFGITTPLFYLLSGLFGSLLLIYHFAKNIQKQLENTLCRNNLIFLACFLGPILVVIALRSVLYDGWRQLYFIYPSFVLLCVYGLHYIYKKGGKKLIIIASFIVLSFSLLFMIENHPFQHLYFNQFADTKTPEHLRHQFELDYWGTSYKQAYDHILANDKSEIIKIKVENIPGTLNRMILPIDERKRIKLVESIVDADYFITNYRGHHQDYEEIENIKWYSIKVDNYSINSIYKLKK